MRRQALTSRLRRTAFPALLLAAGLVVALTGSLAVPQSAHAGFLTPESGGSPNANEIHSLYKVVLYIAAFVFIIVEGALAYSLYKFRAKKGAVAAQTHGNSRLEIGWTVGAALILVVLTVVTFVKLPGIVNPPNSDANGLVLSASLGQPSPPNGKKLIICVQGRQYLWRFTYGAGCADQSYVKQLAYSYYEMVAPANTTVVLRITAQDVIHDWWVPKLGGKVDAVPGYTTYTWFKAPHAGSTYLGHCAQLCGRQHAYMTMQVKIVTPAQYQEWITRQQQQIVAQSAHVAQLRQILTATGNL